MKRIDRKEYQKEYYKKYKNRVDRKDYYRKYAKTHKRDRKEYQRKYQEGLKNNQVFKRRILKDKHKPYLSIEEYNNLFTLQNGECAICNKHQVEFKKALAIDHDHKTGKIRGLLCFKCNVMIGLAKDNIQILENAINYLKNY